VREVGDTGWRPLPRDWLSPESQCAGTAPLGETDVDWWKTPTDPAPSSYWVWYNASDKTPLRLAFQKASNGLAVEGQAAISGATCGLCRRGQTSLPSPV